MIPIKTISVNGKIVEADTCKNVNLVIPIKVSDLTNDLEFV
jgi:hypothetical protein